MINQLVKGIKEKDAPIVVGLDPMLSYVPKQVQETAFKEYGEKSPCGYECWSCSYCGKWTGNFKYN